VSRDESSVLEYFFMDYGALIIYGLVLLSGFHYRKILFPLKDIKIELRYRLALMLGWIPLVGASIL
jgi:hypothetical protein